MFSPTLPLRLVEMTYARHAYIQSIHESAASVCAAPHLLCPLVEHQNVCIGVSGHKRFEMVRRYAHQNAEHVQKALSKLDRRVALPGR
jgi:hypothetical protein